MVDSAERERQRSAARYDGPEPTLGALHSGHGWVWAHCALPCAHNAAIPLAPIVTRLGTEAPANALRKRLRCTICGARQAELALPSWVSLGTGFAPLPLERVPLSLRRAMVDNALREIRVGTVRRRQSKAPTDSMSGPV
jgi:hypothetical protein